jgi:hypothetical protein
MPDPVEDTTADTTMAANEEETDVEAHGVVLPVEDTTIAATDEEPDVEAHGVVLPVEDTVNSVVN